MSMARSNLDAEGEAWEMRFRANWRAPRQRAARVKRIAAAIREALTLVGYDGMLDPYADG
jgi:hypothetical protein